MLDKKRILLIITFVIVFIIIMGYILFFNNDEGIKKIATTTREKLYNWKKKEVTTTSIKVYYSFKDDDLATVKDGEEDVYAENEWYDFLNAYSCTLDDCRTYGHNKEKGYVIIKDESYVIYDYRNDLYTNLSLPNIEYGDVFLLSYDDKDYGLAVSDATGKYAFYDLQRKTFTTEFKYDSISSSDLAGLTLGVFSASFKEGETLKYYLVNYECGKIEKESSVPLKSVGNKNNVYFYERYDLADGYEAVLYDGTLNELFNGEKKHSFGVSSSGNLAIKNNDNFSIYNKKGTLIKESKPYQEVFLIYDDYVIVKDNDDYLKVIDYDGNVEAKYRTLDDSNVFDKNLSSIRYLNGNKVIYLPVINTNTEEVSMYYYSVIDKSSGLFSIND